MRDTRYKIRVTGHGSRVTRRGFTITEVVIASALLIIATVPILKALTNVHVNSIVIERKTISLVLAQSKLEDVRARSIYNYTNSGSSFTQNNISLDGSYLCNVTDNAADPLKTITVAVGYDDNASSSLDVSEVEVTLTTYLARRW